MSAAPPHGPRRIRHNRGGASDSGGEAPPPGAASLMPRKSGEADNPEPTKKFEAPHRMEKETFFTHLAGVTAVSLWRTSSWIVGHLPAGPVYRVGGWLA